MGRKRKHRDRDSEEQILKKLRRLEKEICSRRRRRRRRRDSSGSYSSESRSEYENQTHWQNEYENSYYSPTNETYYENEIPQPEIPPPLAANIDVPQNALETDTQKLDNSQQPSTSTKNDESDVIVGEISHLDDEILTLLGDAPKEESPVGPDIHSDIASRLQDVLQNGLKKEQKDKLIEEHPIPGNCPLFNAPVLNAEVKAAISDMLQKKDASLAARQRQVGTALSALVKSMDILVNDKSDSSQKILKHVSGACRLLCDSHYIDTKLRRSFLISTLNNKMKDTLKESKRDKSLFGEDLSEKLKATKAITKSGLDLKYNKPRSTITKNPTSTNTQSNLNWKHPQPNYQNPNRRPAPSYRPAGAPTSSHYRSRAEADNRRRPPPPRARAGAHYKRRQ